MGRGYARRVALAGAERVHPHQVDSLDDGQTRFHIERQACTANLEAEPSELIALHDRLGIKEGANRADEIDDG